MKEYKEPKIYDGQVVEIYACKGNTCNGKSNMINLDESEFISENNDEVINEKIEISV